MSEHFYTCPGCQSLILSDTAACPECGHTFRADAVAPANAPLERSSATVHQRCPKCGDEVPAGLVRCWSCNTFMRDDVAERYKSLVDNPQKIIFSDVPPSERTETIPPRSTRGGYARIVDAEEEDEFTLQGDDAGPDEFELDTGDSKSTAVQSSAAAGEMGTAAEKTDEESASEPTASPVAAQSGAGEGEEVTRPESRDDSGAEQPPQDVSDEDLLSIALTQEKEADVRKRQRRAAIQRKRILIPCPSCGVWLRVREEQSGRTVRCRSCQTAIPVPAIRKKEKKAEAEKVPELVLDWIEDLHMHLVVPTEITMKPGSLKDGYQVADATFANDALQLTILGPPPKKKSLFSRGDAIDLPQRRVENREHIKSSGEFTGLPHGESYSISSEAMKSIRLVQPVRQAHESMFAGVPVFGEGLIAIYLPVQLDEGRQLYCSMPLTLWRKFSYHLQEAGVQLPAKENGVPDKEIHVAPQCHYTKAKVESIREVVYYEQDPAYELELSGYRCAACGIAVSESARAKNKLGGSAGKSIAKAKCPACSAKFGSEPLYRISKSPETLDEEAGEGALTPTDGGAAAAENTSAENGATNGESADEAKADS